MFDQGLGDQGLWTAWPHDHRTQAHDWFFPPRRAAQVEQQQKVALIFRFFVFILIPTIMQSPKEADW